LTLIEQVGRSAINCDCLIEQVEMGDRPLTVIALFEQVNMGGGPLTVIFFVPSYDVNLGVYQSVSAGLCRLGFHPDRAECKVLAGYAS